MTKRHRGFVIGVDVISGHEVWKVRVNDSRSEHHGKKFSVASVNENVRLAKGLNVHFLIGTVDDEHGKKSPRAVDVRVEIELK
ncbi:MAG: hypothetical protein KGI41_03650 [Patescibacteria group bacterium]|nr:hypothetical protein [Patescibacteria group bacterium]MDE1966306.1 hypothetical protein [Patescibacteria group bacterium]